MVRVGEEILDDWVTDDGSQRDGKLKDWCMDWILKLIEWIDAQTGCSNWLMDELMHGLDVWTDWWMNWYMAWMFELIMIGWIDARKNDRQMEQLIL